MKSGHELNEEIEGLGQSTIPPRRRGRAVPGDATMDREVIAKAIALLNGLLGDGDKSDISKEGETHDHA